MKKISYLILVLCVLCIPTTYPQVETNDPIIKPDLIIGNYGISLKDNVIGRFGAISCDGSNGEVGKCVGYIKDDTIKLDSITLVFIDKDIKLKKELGLDLQVIASRYDSTVDSEKKDGLYIDKEKAYTDLYSNRAIATLDGYRHLDQSFFIKEDSIAYLDHSGLYRLTSSKNLDISSFTPITKRLFYDASGIYYVEDDYTMVANKMQADFIKLEDRTAKQEISITIKDEYCIINDKVYSLDGKLIELSLNLNQIHMLKLDEYSDHMLLSDGNKTYERDPINHGFDEVSCEDELDKIGPGCIMKNLKETVPLRKTWATEYYIDSKNATLYFDANKNLNLTETSGHLFTTKDGFYFTDFDRFSLSLDTVKIWNSESNDYEDIDLDQYQHIYQETYWYKGNLYGHNSDVLYENFKRENARVLLTFKHKYFVNDELIIGLEEESKQLDLSALTVLNFNDGQPSDYLIGSDYLIYNNKIIKNIDTKNIQILHKDILKNDTSLIVGGEKFKINELPFKIAIY